MLRRGEAEHPSERKETMTTTARELQVQRDAQADALKASIKGKVCATCDGYPFVAWVKGEYVLRCKCGP